MKKFLAGAVGMILLLGAAALYVVQSRGGGPADNARPVAAGHLELAKGNLYFRNLAKGPDQGKLSAVSVADPDGPRQVEKLRCDRFATARGTSICLRLKPGSLPPYTEMLVLGPDLAVQHKETLPGTPSRARVSPDGKIVNWTVFVSGDSYATTGFSTRSGLYEVETKTLIKSIEELPVFVDGRRYFASDVNYWGITFDADGKHFYATLGSKGKTYLIKADYRSYRGESIAQNVECPSLSPDGKRIAFKHKNPDGSWRLAVLELATGQVTHAAEGRAIDDQPLWKDDNTLLYAVKRGASSDIWSTPITPTGTPQLLVPDAASPAVG
ncbi:TolB family protein [Kribbella sp. CA-294648]|uniref:TolB family protein n=1 Tax=Kribbella sp. CA-294648 TaxID=3239948 RepID=UPI003D90C1A3